MGLSTSPASGGAYALILKEVNGNRRLPIIIGAFEAQSIALEMEGIKPPRPLTHELFFSVLEQVFLTDGEISPSEEFYLLKMLYSDREIRQPERDFLRRLRKKLPTRSQSFENLFETAMAAPAKNWSVGGSGS